MHRLLNCDVLDLIEDENLKREIILQQECEQETHVDMQVDISQGPQKRLRQKLSKARKRRAESFDFLCQSLENVKRLKKDCIDVNDEVNDLERQLQVELTSYVNIKPERKEIKDVDQITETMAKTSFQSETNTALVPASDILNLAEDPSKILCSKKHHEPKYQCAVCFKKYYDKDSFESHVDSHTGVTYKCEICDKKPFTSAKPLQTSHALAC